MSYPGVFTVRGSAYGVYRRAYRVWLRIRAVSFSVADNNLDGHLY